MAQCNEKVAGERCGLAPNHGGLCVPVSELVQCKAHFWQAYDGVLFRCEIHSPEGAVHIEDHAVNDFRWQDRIAVYPETPEFARVVGEMVGVQVSRLDEAGSGTPPVGPAGVANPDRTQVAGDHYTRMPIQPWAVIESLGLDFFQGNALKYLMRAGRKGPALEDLKKAKHYIEKCIEREERRG